jgi:phosphate transport system substrate-binding protein
MEPKAREFIRFVLSREGQELVQKDGKYLPLTADAAREELGKLERFK